jgi:hypothetical protein
VLPSGKQWFPSNQHAQYALLMYAGCPKWQTQAMFTYSVCLWGTYVTQSVMYGVRHQGSQSV